MTGQSALELTDSAQRLAAARQRLIAVLELGDELGRSVDVPMLRPISLRLKVSNWLLAVGTALLLAAILLAWLA